MIILALDGLEIEYVRLFKCKHLLQSSFGKTDISEFKDPRTVVLWASFLVGKNIEKRVLASKNIWDFKLSINETFFHKFKNYKLIDVPTLNYNDKIHRIEREMLKKFFNKQITIKKYDEIILKNHMKTKNEFFNHLNRDYEILMCYFATSDLIGHLSFGIKTKMRLIYQELDSIARTAQKYDDIVLIISDHGMKSIGRFGDHSNYGFWSLSIKKSLHNPKLTNFYKLIDDLATEKNF